MKNTGFLRWPDLLNQLPWEDAAVHASRGTLEEQDFAEAKELGVIKEENYGQLFLVSV